MASSTMACRPTARSSSASTGRPNRAGAPTSDATRTGSPSYASTRGSRTAAARARAWRCASRARSRARPPPSSARCATTRSWCGATAAVGEVTVDPTPFTVVLATNPRHAPGTRLLFVHDNACVDAVVEPWPESDIDIKEGSRHCLSVEGRQVSGWLTKVTKDGATDNLKPADDGDESHFILTSSKALAVRAGCDPQQSEKTGTVNPKTPLRVLEVRETEEFGIRAYVSTIPGQAITVTAALNEFNHSVQRFPSVAEYEAARANYLEDIVVREALVEDAITGNNLRIKDQTLHISTATDAADNCAAHPGRVERDERARPRRAAADALAQPRQRLPLDAAGARARGAGHRQDVDGQAGRLHARRPAAARRRRRTTASAWCRSSSSCSASSTCCARAPRTSSARARCSSGTSSPSTPARSTRRGATMLMQAYEMRALIVLLDGVDEAAGLRDQIEDFVHKEIVPSATACSSPRAPRASACDVLEDLCGDEPVPAHQRAAAARDQHPDAGQHLLRPPALAGRGAQAARRRLPQGRRRRSRRPRDAVGAQRGWPRRLDARVRPRGAAAGPERLALRRGDARGSSRATSVDSTPRCGREGTRCGGISCCSTHRRRLRSCQRDVGDGVSRRRARGVVLLPRAGGGHCRERAPQVAVQLGVLLQKQRRPRPRRRDRPRPAKAKGEERGAKRGDAQGATPKAAQGAGAATKREARAVTGGSSLGRAVAAHRARTDEIYVVHEHMQPTLRGGRQEAGRRGGRTRGREAQ